MKKVLKIILYVFLGIVAFGLIMGLYGTKGLKEVKAFEFDSIDLSSVEDGEYTGEYQKGRWSNTVVVTVSNHRITDIQLLDSGNAGHIDVHNQVMDEVIDAQDITIDTVSGGTATTNSLLKAIEDALK